MARPRRPLILAAATAAIAVGVLAAPVSAADPRLALVNGIPGERVDVCFGNREVASRVRYGDWFQRVVAPGALVVRFRRAAPGTCQGRVLASQALTLGADDDRTVVGTRRQDKVVWFVNDPVTVGPGAWLSFVRHAADVGPVVFTLSFDSPISPDALPPTFTKGDSDREQGTGQDSFWISATRPNQSEAMAEKHVLVVEGRRGEVILVGDRSSNARFVIINRPTLPAP
jgi:hypothetical protein